MLLVDRAAAAVPPLPAEISTSATGIRVFISSVMDGMKEERNAAAAAVRGLSSEPVMFESFGGRDSDPEAEYFAEVAASHIYVGLLGSRYGKLLPSRRSATHQEYRGAERRGLRVSVWTSGAEDWNGDQQVLVDEVRQFHVTGSYADIRASPSLPREGQEPSLRVADRAVVRRRRSRQNRMGERPSGNYNRA